MSSYKSFYPSFIISAVRDYLFENGLSSSQIERETGIDRSEVQNILRTYVLDASNATTEKEYQVYKLLTLDDFAPHHIALRLKTGEEEIRHILLTLERVQESSESSDSSDSSDSSESETTEETEEAETTSDESECSETSEASGPEAKDVVYFYFTHNVKDEDICEKVRISKEEDSYKIETFYHCNDSGSYSTKSEHHEYNVNGLLRHCRTLLKMAALDQNAYHSIEFQIPSCISFSFKPKEADFHVARIINNITTLFVEPTLSIDTDDKVYLYFTQRDSTDDNMTEDLITIQREEEGYMITVTYGRNNTTGKYSHKSKKMVYTMQDLLKYCRYNLTMACIDQKPYKEVEVSLPGCISFSFIPNDMKKHIPQILAGIRNAFFE